MLVGKRISNEEELRVCLARARSLADLVSRTSSPSPRQQTRELSLDQSTAARREMGERPPARPLYSAYRVPSSNPTSPTTRAPPTSLELASTSADGLNGSLHASYSGESSASSSNVLSTSSRATAGAPASDAPASSSGALLSADRSCDRCRARRVRCDRSHPFCQRCVKGNQECNYPSITSWYALPLASLPPSPLQRRASSYFSLHGTSSDEELTNVSHYTGSTSLLMNRGPEWWNWKPNSVRS